MLALAGCAAGPEGGAGSSAGPAGPAAGASDGPALDVVPPAPTQADHVLVHGTVSRATTLSFSLTHHNATRILPPLAVEGAWTVDVPLDVGTTDLRVRAEAAGSAVDRTLSLVRVASGRVLVDFKGYPGHADRDDTVWFNVDEGLSAPMYEAEGARHPAYANVHDLMVAWTDSTGLAVGYGYDARFGFEVTSIDGVGSPLQQAQGLYWCYRVNGTPASLGITSQPFHPGDEVAWDLGCV